MNFKFCLATLFLAHSSFVCAGGFQVALQGQRQIGMAHTGTGLAYDATSIFFNPGGLSFTKRNNIIFGGSIIRSRVNYLAAQEINAPSSYNAMTQSPLGTPFAFYASYGKSNSLLKFGLGIYTPYGSSVKWADDWKGFSVLQSLKLQSIYIQPSISYRFGKLGLGVGFGFCGVGLGGVERFGAVWGHGGHQTL